MKYDLTHEDARLNKLVPLLNQLSRGSLGQNLPKRFQIDTVDAINSINGYVFEPQDGIHPESFGDVWGL